MIEDMEELGGSAMADNFRALERTLSLNLADREGILEGEDDEDSDDEGDDDDDDGEDLTAEEVRALTSGRRQQPQILIDDFGGKASAGVSDDKSKGKGRGYVNGPSAGAGVTKSDAQQNAERKRREVTIKITMCNLPIYLSLHLHLYLTILFLVIRVLVFIFASLFNLLISLSPSLFLSPSFSPTLSLSLSLSLTHTHTHTHTHPLSLTLSLYLAIADQYVICAYFTPYIFHPFTSMDSSPRYHDWKSFSFLHSSFQIIIFLSYFNRCLHYLFNQSLPSFNSSLIFLFYPYVIIAQAGHQ